MNIVNIAAYKFVPLSDLRERRPALRDFCQRLGLQGTILLSTEGINLFVAGEREAIDQLLDQLQADEEIGSLAVKESLTAYQPFNRMLVKIKKEIIAFGVEGIAPAVQTSRKIAPQELKQWLDEGREVMMLDTRNEYEIDLGTFDGAVRLGLDDFRHFPQAVEQQLPAETRKKPLVMFCTGGIRCEKAGPLMEKMGFEEVFQLDGGILNYFEQVGQSHYQGDCFVFDQRVAVDATLRETDAAQCYACQAILTAEEQASPRYSKGQSCPHCYRTSEEEMAESIARRHRLIGLAASPLPGDKPYDNYRPVHVTGRYVGVPLVDFLVDAIPSVSREKWFDEIERDRLLLDNQPVAATQLVTPGEKYHHLLPSMVEPEVATDISILYEDASIVLVNKPAPLPIHQGGRYNKNTLSSLLAPAYYPEHLRHVHRLDANTTGLVLHARTRRMAHRLQAEFASGTVDKRYLARVAGHPESDEFACHAPMAVEISAAGTRRPPTAGAEKIAAKTQFRLVRRFDDGTSLVEANPITGRTNQIRMHLWSLGLPILGDPTYLPGGEIADRQVLSLSEPPMCLHAWKLQFRHPSSGDEVDYQAPAPSWSL